MLFGMPKEIAGTIVAAAIAAAISLLGLIISKESKVSEFRQAWIDSLREEIATVITRATAMKGAHLARFAAGADLWQVAREDFVSLNEAWAKIRLRLNPKEQSHAEVLLALKEHEALFQRAAAAPDDAALAAADLKLLDATRIVLKQEWERVKRGEFVYLGTTVAAGLLLVTCLFFLLKPLIPFLN
jgi:hypothetical protein